MKNRGKKILNLFRRKCIAPLAYINNDYYMLCMNKYLKSIGVKLEGGGRFTYIRLFISMEVITL